MNRITVDELLARHGTVTPKVTPVSRYEECARCNRWHRLVRIGRLWLQPPHDCRVIENEAVS